jgi:predicted amidohydrolase YtcJ
MLDAYHELLRQGRFTMRNYAMLADNAQLIDRHTAHGPIHLAYDGRLSVRAIKLFIDGAMGSRGAALFDAYNDDPGNRGLLRITQAHIEEVCRKALRSGFQVCTHAIGDRGNHIVLDAYESVLKSASTSSAPLDYARGRSIPHDDRRWRVEHAQLLTAGDIPRFAQLGIIPSMQTTHAISDMRWALARLGPDRVTRAYAWRSLLDTGVIVPNGTVAPVE